MTTDNLPAAATPITLDGSQVHRDWRHLGAETAGIITALAGGGSLTTATFNLLIVGWILAGIAGVSAVALIAFLTLMVREGRRWTITADHDTP